MIRAFYDVCGYQPGDQEMVLLQRLPGLGVYPEDENSRIFIDETFADACRAGDLVAFTQRPFDFELQTLSGVECATESVGVSIAAVKAEEVHLSEGAVNTATH